MKRNERTLADLVASFVRQKPLKEPYTAHKIGQIWKAALGPTIQSYTEKIDLRNGVLTVRLTSATLRHELAMGEEKLRQLLNSRLQEDLIQEIRFY